jgi:hypothetical protein
MTTKSSLHHQILPSYGEVAENKIIETTVGYNVNKNLSCQDTETLKITILKASKPSH